MSHRPEGRPPVARPGPRRDAATRSVPDRLDVVAEAGLLLLLLFAPLPFGSVQKSAVFGLVAWTAALGWLVFTRRTFLSLPLADRGWGMALLGAACIGALQVCPLPRSLAGRLSPASLALRDSIPLGTRASWVPVSVDPGATVEYLARLLAFGAVFALASCLASRGGARRRILGVLFLVGLFEAAYGGAEYLSGHQHIFGYAKRFYTDAATGTYINQNHYAGALEMALLVGLGFYLARLRPSSGHGAVRGGWRTKLAALLDGEGARTLAIATAVAIVALGLVLSYSRTGLAAGTLAATVVAVIEIRRQGGRRRTVSIVLLGLAVLVLVGLVGWRRVEGDLERQMGGLSWDDGRFRVWRDSVGIVRDYPILGSGLGTFREIYPVYRNERIGVVYDHAHNDYLQLLVETGLAGAVAAAALLGLFWWRIGRSLVRLRGPDFPLLLGAAGGLASLMLHEVMDFNLQIPANALLFSALAGTLLGGVRAAEEEEADWGPMAGLIPFVDARKRRARASAPGGTEASRSPDSIASRRTALPSAAQGGSGFPATMAAPGTPPREAVSHAALSAPSRAEPRAFAWAVRTVGALLAVAVTLAALRCWREFRGGALLAEYRTAAEVDYREAGGDPEAVIANQIEQLRRALALGSVDAEAEADLAVEMVNAANAHVLAGAADAAGQAEVARCLQGALSAVAAALRASPLNTEGWLAGYRVVTSSILLGMPETATHAGELSGHGPEALSEMFVRGAVRSDPNRGALHRDLAELMLAAGDRSKALVHYRRAVRDPSVDAVEIARRMLDAGYEAGEVLETMPARGPALCGAGRLLQEHGRKGLAERAWLRATEQSDASSDPWTALSHLAESQGRHIQALAYAKKAFPLLPTLPRGARSEVLFCAAMAARSLGQIDSAVEYGTGALRDNPGHLYLYNFLGSLLYDRGDAAGAIKHWQTLIDRYDTDPYVTGNLALFHRMIGEAYEKLDLRAAAIDHYVEALRAAPADAESKAALARLSAR